MIPFSLEYEHKGDDNLHIFMKENPQNHMKLLKEFRQGEIYSGLKNNSRR